MRLSDWISLEAMVNRIEEQCQVENNHMQQLSSLEHEVGDKGDQVLILLGDLVKVPKVNTESQAAIFFLGEEDRCTVGDCDDQMNPLPSMSSKNL